VLVRLVVNKSPLTGGIHEDNDTKRKACWFGLLFLTTMTAAVGYQRPALLESFNCSCHHFEALTRHDDRN